MRRATERNRAVGNQYEQQVHASGKAKEVNSAVSSTRRVSGRAVAAMNMHSMTTRSKALNVTLVTPVAANQQVRTPEILHCHPAPVCIPPGFSPDIFSEFRQLTPPQEFLDGSLESMDLDTVTLPRIMIHEQIPSPGLPKSPLDLLEELNNAEYYGTPDTSHCRPEADCANSPELSPFLPNELLDHSPELVGSSLDSDLSRISVGTPVLSSHDDILEWFEAQNMRDREQELADLFKEINEHIDFEINFDS